MSYVYECFTGEFVSIVLNKDEKNSVAIGDTIRPVQKPMIVLGFMIEEDDHYFFLGHDPDLICIAVKKNQVVVIEVADPNEQMAHELNDAVETPKNDLGVN